MFRTVLLMFSVGMSSYSPHVVYNMKLTLQTFHNMETRCKILCHNSIVFRCIYDNNIFPVYRTCDNTFAIPCVCDNPSFQIKCTLLGKMRGSGDRICCTFSTYNILGLIFGALVVGCLPFSDFRTSKILILMGKL